MKFYFITGTMLILQLAVSAQLYNKKILDSLEKISSSQNQSWYFASVYKNAILKTNEQIANKPEGVQRFITAFENEFSQLFFKSDERYRKGSAVLENWTTYYQKRSLNTLQYITIGINAHINGDFWKSLVQAHSYDSIVKYKKELIRFQRSMNSITDSFYHSAKSYKRVNIIHRLSLGLDRVIAKRMILRWRKKQVHLALLYYTNQQRLNRQLKRNEKKMKRFDLFVIRWLK